MCSPATVRTPRRPIPGSSIGKVGCWVRPPCRACRPCKKNGAPRGTRRRCYSVTRDYLHEPRYFDKPQEQMTSATIQPDWKGLHTDQMPVFLGYDQTERMIAALLDRAAQWQPEVVVGIARGGLVPATMAAGILALPLAMVGFERTTGATQWIGSPAPGGRVL